MFKAKNAVTCYTDLKNGKGEQLEVTLGESRKRRIWAGTLLHTPIFYNGEEIGYIQTTTQYKRTNSITCLKKENACVIGIDYTWLLREHLLQSRAN